MKKAIVIILLLGTTCSRSQEPFSPQPSPFTNGSVIIRGILGTRSSAARRYGHVPEVAVLRGLRMFKRTQNEDGSWGDGDERRLATPLVLMSLLSHGESRASQEFGQSVARAHEWTLATQPATDAERTSIVIALSVYVDLHAGKRRDLVKAEVAKIKALLSAVQNMQANPWVDLLTFHDLPQEIARPGWMKYTRDFPRRWSEREVNANPTTMDDYVALRVAGLAKFRLGGKVWTQFNREVTPTTVERQTDDGYYPCEPEADRFACTALAVQSLQVYYAYQPRYWAQPEPEPKHQIQDEEIEIDITL